MKTIYLLICLFGSGFSITPYILYLKKDNLLPISTNRFSELQEYLLENNKNPSYAQNLNKEEVHIVYFEEKDMFEFYNNDRQASGICGDIWTLLSEYLNFTLVLKKSEVNFIGSKINSHNNFSGLIGMLQRKEYSVIPKMESFYSRPKTVDITVPFWKSNHRLFIKPIYAYKSTWIFQMISWKFFYIYLLFYLLLCFLSIMSQKMSYDKCPDQVINSVLDYLFYNFSISLNQGDIFFEYVQRYSKLLAFSVTMFYWIVTSSYNSELLVHMSHQTFQAPFHDLEELYNNTDYTVLVRLNGIAHVGVQERVRPIFSTLMNVKRIHFLSSFNEMQELVCSNHANYAMFQNKYKKKIEAMCEVKPVGVPYFRMWIAAGIDKDFKYKRAINSGIMRLHENGIIDALKSHWLDRNIKNNPKASYEIVKPVDLNQVIVVYIIYLTGLCFSVIILLIEMIVHKYLKIK